MSPLDVHRMVAHPEGAPPWSEGHPAMAGTGVRHSDGMDIPGIRGCFGAVEMIGIIVFRCLRRFRTPPQLFSQNPKDIQKFPMENPKGIE